MRGGESGATAHRIDTGNVADLPVRACYGKPQLYLMNDEETRETPAFPPHRARHRRRPAGGQSVAAHRCGRRTLEAEPGHPHHRAGRPRRHHRHRRPPAGGFPPAGLGPVLRGRQQVGRGRRHRLQRGREGQPRRLHRPDGQYRPAVDRLFALPQHALRAAKPGAGVRRHHGAQRAGGPSLGAGQDRPRVRRLAEGPERQGLLRLLRHRPVAAPVGRLVPAAHRHQGRAHPLSRRGARAAGPDGGRDPVLLRQPHDRRSSSCAPASSGRWASPRRSAIR